MSKKGVQSAVLEYLTNQNRPYSAVDIFNNLHKEYGKTAVVKALENLATSGKIHEKTYGKQKAYAPKQDQYGDYNEDELKALDKEITELQNELKDLQQMYNKQQTELNSLNGQLTTEMATAEVQQLKSECEVMKSKIKAIKSQSNGITPEDKDKAAYDTYRHLLLLTAVLAQSDMLATDVINSILEGYPKSKKHLLEEVGVETDEDVGISL